MGSLALQARKGGLCGKAPKETWGIGFWWLLWVSGRIVGNSHV